MKINRNQILPSSLKEIKDQLTKKAPSIFEKAMQEKKISTEEILQLIHPSYRSGKKLMDAIDLLTKVFTAQRIFVTYGTAVKSYPRYSMSKPGPKMEIVISDDDWERVARRLLKFFKCIKNLSLSNNDKEIFFYYYGLTKTTKRLSPEQICKVLKIKDLKVVNKVITTIWGKTRSKFKSITPVNLVKTIQTTSEFARQNNKWIDWGNNCIKPLI